MREPTRAHAIFYSGRTLGEASAELGAICADPCSSETERANASGYLASISNVLLARDETITQATLITAETVAVDPVRGTFLEARLEDALIAAWATVSGDPSRGRVRLPVPGWDPQPGATDWVVTNDRGQPAAIAELKVTDVEAALWDLLKVACILSAARGMCGYLLVATTPSRWEKAEVAELFAGPVGQSATWWTGDLLLRWQASWRWLLRGGRARPTAAPMRLRTSLLAAAPTRRIPDHELRLVKVEAMAGDQPLEFREGQPIWGEMVTDRDLISVAEEEAGRRDSLEEQRSRMRRPED